MKDKVVTKMSVIQKHIWKAFLVLAIMVSVTVLGVYAVQNISRSQYEERVAYSNVLMEKICHNIQTAIDFNWQSIHCVVGQMEYETFTSWTELMEYVSNFEGVVKDGTYTKILLISKAGVCYTTDGTYYKQISPSILSEDEDVMYITEKQSESKTKVKKHYLSRFHKPITVDGITFTHVSLVCEMGELDSYFDVSNYGEESITYIIRQDGSPVYRQEKQNSLSDIDDLLSALKDAEFGFGASYEQFKSDIENNVSDSVYLRLQDKGYFVSYYPLGIEDWTVVLLAPEEQVASGTQIFTKEIIISVVLLCVACLVVLFSVIGVSLNQINKKRKQVNMQLIKAAEAEREANAAKTNFLSAMSHDIRTPMNAIIGMVMLADQHSDDAAYMKECLDKIRASSDHLLTLVNNILDINRVESGNMVLNPERFSITDCFSKLTNIMQQQMKEKKQDWRMGVHNIEHEYLYGDELRLNQIFINLWGNAVKYTEEGGSVWVDLYEEMIDGVDDAVRLKFVVQDNGIGMSEEFQENMYRSFARANDSRTNKTQGSGLGLAICKQLVDLMGGTIACESELGAGTTFTVCIDVPIATAEPEEMPPVNREIRQKVEKDFSSLAGIRVLVAEDNDLNWEIAETVLNMYGIVSERAQNGKICCEMLHSVAEGYYSLVLMDVRMPLMDGCETTRVLRASDKEWLHRIPIVAMTADVFSEDVQECLAAGMNEHISKPFDMDRLLHVLQKYCA